MPSASTTWAPPSTVSVAPWMPVACSETSQPIVAATSLGVGDLEMDLLARTVTRGGKRIELLAQEFKVL